ncbi:hypothetical protein LSAT2_027261 [Lamellibrachia satsuma]|nr:hypothetical protein LSAT2_027261 [Lamellibrachia satsuma]
MTFSVVSLSQFKRVTQFCSELVLLMCITTCSSLTNLTLDHNEFGDEGCQKLCNGLQGNQTLLSLSMTYCDLGVDSGTFLGKLIVKTAIRDLYLDGNSLQSEGTMELVQALADRAELENIEREESTKRSTDDEAVTAMSSLKAKERGFSSGASESQGAADSDGGSKKSSVKKKKGKKKKKSKEPPGPPLIGPWIRRLHLADNEIDAMGPTGLVGPISCTQLLGTLLQHSTCLEELDLDDNLIGDMAGRQILAALEARAASGLSAVKAQTTHRMKSDTFNGIFKLGSGLKKKKKKGRKKKKK